MVVRNAGGEQVGEGATVIECDKLIGVEKNDPVGMVNLIGDSIESGIDRNLVENLGPTLKYRERKSFGL